MASHFKLIRKFSQFLQDSIDNCFILTLIAIIVVICNFSYNIRTNKIEYCVKRIYNEHDM